MRPKMILAAVTASVAALALAVALSWGDDRPGPAPAAAQVEKEKTMAAKPDGPRKVIVGTCMFAMWGEFPGLDKRLDQLGGLVDDMARRAKEKYGPQARLDLAVLPEYGVAAGNKGSAAAQSVDLTGQVHDYFAAQARRHQCYIVAAMELADDRGRGLCSNAAVLFDRAGNVVGIYRKVHPVAGPGDTELEGGMMPGREFPVFDCDFGKLGVQICYDMSFADGWQALKARGAEIVAWPTQSPQTLQTVARAMENGYYIVSSTWRDNASLLDPTGAVIAQITKPDERVLVEQIDLDYALLPWQARLQDGKIFDQKYGARAGYRYSAREDGGIFWSNDPKTPIRQMVRELGLETQAQDLTRNKALQDKIRGIGPPVAAAPPPAEAKPPASPRAPGAVEP